MNNFWVDPDFHVGFLIGSAIYIVAVLIHRFSKGRDDD